jgi:hypothetical protein
MIATFALSAIPMAYLLARKQFRGKRLITAIIDLPIVIPHSAAGIAILGFINRDSILGHPAGYFGTSYVGGEGGIIGNLDKAFLMGVLPSSVFAPSQIPELVFVAYQMMFAIITPALITGAFSNRVRFGAYLWFLVFWLLLVYFPFVHMIWGGGLLAEWGVLDFAGGIVVHNIAGMAALASVLYVGRRKVQDSLPHSIPLVALGTGLLWYGWYGFNAGSELQEPVARDPGSSRRSRPSPARRSTPSPSPTPCSGSSTG